MGRRSAGACGVLVLLVLVVLGPHQALCSGSSKVACDYSNRLCQWNASYAFGAAVLGDLAFFHGGLYSNDATTPVNGSHIEVMDLRTMSPYSIQVESAPLLHSTRYKHFLTAWDGQLLAAGGFVDDVNGKSRPVLDVIALDLNTRTWSSLKNFTWGGDSSVVINFEAVVVSGDYLLAAFQVIDPRNSSRQYQVLDLTTQEVTANYQLFEGALMLDWPLIAIMSLTPDGDTPHLVLQAKREMQAATGQYMIWTIVTEDKASRVGFSVTSKLRVEQQSRRGGCKVLALNILQVGGRPRLVMYTLTTARFANSTSPQDVNAVVVFDISVMPAATNSTTGSSVSLQLSRVLLTPPLHLQLTTVRSVDLPLLGSVLLSAADVSLLPYVGRVDDISTIDSRNVNIQQGPGGFVIKGSGLADQVCQPGATWQPFVVSARFYQPGPPHVVAVSNYTWCPTRQQQLTAAQVVNDAVALATNTKLFRVNSSAGVQLFLLNAQVVVAGGGSYRFVDTSRPLMGAFINLNTSSVTNFTIQPGPGYMFPSGLASCMTVLGDRPVYVEAGGSRYIPEQQVDGDVMSKGLYVMDAAVNTQQHALLPAAGGEVVPQRAQSAVACSPDGRVYMFGGLVPATGSNSSQAAAAPYKPVAGLHAFSLAGSTSSPRVSKAFEATGVGREPAPRSGHALAYLPPSTVSGLGMSQGALMLYGGSNISAASLEDFQVTDNETTTAASLRTTSWDTAVWLFDLSSRQWQQLSTQGTKLPGLMYHSMQASGKQVVVFGGQAYDAAEARITLSTMLYVLDFSSSPPRWRQAQIRLNNQGAFQFGHPNTGVVMLPEFGAVALKHRSAINLAPIPQSLEFRGEGQAILASWGLATLNTTAGDWLRLAPTQPRLTLTQPLLVAADVLLSGVVPAGSTGSGAGGGAGRHLLQKPGMLLLQCDAGKQPRSALYIRSGGAELSNMVIRGCNNTGVDVRVDATGAYTAPAVLTNITLTGNTGVQGAAMFIGPATSVVLQGVNIKANTAPQGVVYAAEQSGLTLLNCSLSDNNGSAVVFAGSSLNITSSSFHNNTAAQTPVVAPSAHRSRNYSAGGGLHLVCYERGPGGYDSVTVITNCSFHNNTGIRGGAIYAGAGTTLQLQAVDFLGNTALDGGAVFADRDSCLATHVNSSFLANSAQDRGGAITMHNPSCNSISWQGGRFSSNTAANGGALYLTELTTRSIQGSAVYDNNMAARPVVGRLSRSSAGGAGGAIHLGLWGSQVLLYNSTFTNNSATQFGGAVHSLAIDGSSLQLDGVNATGNTAALVPPSTSDADLIASALRSEGGCLHVDGSSVSVNISRSVMNTNMAGRGGAVSLNSENGSLFVDSSSFSSNTAFTAGGAVSVTEGKSVTMINATFVSNTLLWRELAAGGGFYCFLCSSVNIMSSSFARNRAAYGGGAAVLQPWQASVLSNTSFVNNVALPDPLDDMLAAANRRRRALLAAVTTPHHLSGIAAVNPQLVGGQALAAAILGPIAANVTGDSGYYTGGGGLYVSVSSVVRLQGCAFLSNTAYNGGGFLARTDACKQPSSTQPSTCQLQLAGVSVANNTARAAGGVLITSIRPEVLLLHDCSQGSALTRATLPCLQAPNPLMQQLARAGSTAASGRSLLQLNATADGPETAHAAVRSDVNFLLTAAASVRCQNMLARGSDGEVWADDDCSTPIRAPPGQPFGRAFVLLDGFGDPITAGIYDAAMPMAASVNTSQGMTPYRILGNTTTAQNGTANFTGLIVNGLPGDTVTLTFRTQNGIIVTRLVQLRHCQAGEYTDNSTSSGAEASFSCRPCQSPQYSFYPTALRCSQCARLPANSWSVCNEAAVVPADGFYQSHPRSPVLSRCISSLACRRTAATRMQMATWSYAHANLSVLQLTDIVIQPYMQHMCSHGYTGPLCGSCQPDHGHRGHDCAKCMPQAANSFMYFLVCCFMLLVPVIQMVLHTNSVRKSTQLVAAASKLSWTSQPSFQPRHSHSSTAGRLPSLPTLQEELSVEGMQQPLSGFEVAGTGIKPGQAAVELTLMQAATSASAAPGGCTHNDVSSVDQGPLRVSSGSNADASPFCPTSAVAAAQAGVSEGLASAGVPLLQGPHPLQAPNVAGCSSDSLKAPTLFQRLFDTSPVDHVDESMQAVSPLSMAGPSSNPRREPSRMSVTSAGSLVSKGPLVQPVHDLPLDPRPTGNTAAVALAEIPPLWHSQTCPGSEGAAGTTPTTSSSRMTGQAGVQPALTQMQPVPSTVHRRHYKFWHADILSLLVNYMQLLGVLRLVRINWSERLSRMLVYLDLTSGATTWLSIECSLQDEPGLPRSVQRSIVLLLWPLCALMVLATFWALTACALRNRLWARRRLCFRRWIWQHAVMSVVILLYFLYTTTTREVIGLFSCQQVDDPSQLPDESRGSQVHGSDNPQYSEALHALTHQSSSWSQGVWTSDTAVRCGSPTHVGLVVGLGIPGVLLFALGLPVGLWVLLNRISTEARDGQCRLEDPEIELQYGSVYEKYRYRCYYWGSVILLEAFLLTLLLVMLQAQNNAGLQVLVAMAVIFLEAVLHITFQPYACRLLDTLRRLAVYSLMSTLFMLMLVALSENQQNDMLVAACMVLIGLINGGAVGVHLWACSLEVRRWMLWFSGKGPCDHLTWSDVGSALPRGWRGACSYRWLMLCGCCKPAHGVDRCSSTGCTADGVDTRMCVPVEMSPSMMHMEGARIASEGVSGRGASTGVVVVINPSTTFTTTVAAEPSPTPTAGWLGTSGAV